MNYELSLQIAICAFVYSNILTEENAILNGPYKFLYKFFKTDKRQEEGRPIHPLFMIIIHCEKCVAGQWAFLIFLYNHSHFYTTNLISKHICFTLVTILFTAFIKIIYLKIKNND